MRPADVNEENKDEVWTRIYGYSLHSFPNPKFKIGDHVRLEIKHKTFEKGYEPNFTMNYTSSQQYFAEIPTCIVLRIRRMGRIFWEGIMNKNYL
jgi:hypothetical protein